MERMVKEQRMVRRQRREPEMTRCLESVEVRDRSSVPSVHRFVHRVFDFFATFHPLLLLLHHFVVRIYPVNNDIEIHISLVLISILLSLINC